MFHMADEGGRAPIHAPTNGAESSILASQLAPRLASQGHETHSLTRETFSQLRQELLGERPNQLRVDEGVTNVNKLICIVLKAGLEPGTSSSALEQDLEEQVLDCLDIIQASIEKSPQALWDTSEPLILGEDAHAPLYAWLILRLIKLISTWQSETVLERAHRVCKTVVHSQYKQVRPLPSAFLRACTSGL